jgi:CheY-like chemotaxis protein
MRILILDDDPFRHEVLAERYAADERVHTYTFFEALQQLRNGPYDLMLLDHDLGPGSVSPLPYLEEHTGNTFAQFVCELLTESLRPARVIVHTCNSIGGFKMLENFHRANIPANYEPFRV